MKDVVILAAVTWQSGIGTSFGRPSTRLMNCAFDDSGKERRLERHRLGGYAKASRSGFVSTSTLLISSAMSLSSL